MKKDGEREHIDMCTCAVNVELTVAYSFPSLSVDSPIVVVLPAQTQPTIQYIWVANMQNR